MSEKNGYFKLENKEDGTYIRVYKSEGGGRSLNYDEVSTYLHNRNFEFDLKAVNSAIVNANESIEVKISELQIGNIDEIIELKVAGDKTAAFIKVYPACGSGSQIVYGDISLAFAKAGVKKGIIEETITQILEDKMYGYMYLVAEALAPIEGSDAKIDYAVEISKSSKPKMNADGTVDFKDMELILHVKKGDLLATYTPINLGEPGYDVVGGIIRPKQTRNIPFKIGKNVFLSEDKLQAFAGADGHLVLEEDKIVVSDTYIIEGDVDTSTGNVIFEGSVKVKGGVRAGYEINATGDIEVLGIVEGAKLISGGSIILSKGIQGMNKGVLDAKSNIVAKFIESASVRTGGDLHTECILHSTVYATGDIVCTGKKGLISGGDLRSGSLITAKIVGSNMGTTTKLEVGLDPMIIENYNRLSKEILEEQDALLKLDQIIGFLNKRKEQTGKLEPDKLIMLQKSTQNKIMISSKIKGMTVEYEKLVEQIENKNDGKVKISAVAYPGVLIVIGNIKYFVRDEIKYAQFVRDGADIKVNPYI